MTLQTIGEKYNTDKATYHKYCDFYQKILPNRKFQGRILEIGVMDGASLRMWREYYPKAEIIGIDINDKSHLDIEGVTILQLDVTDLAHVKELGTFDIIIDDGSHLTKDQLNSFLWLYSNQLNQDGFYIIEDLHTSNIDDYKNSAFSTLEWLNSSKLKLNIYQRDELVNDSITSIITGGQVL